MNTIIGATATRTIKMVCRDLLQLVGLRRIVFVGVLLVSALIPKAPAPPVSAGSACVSGPVGGPIGAKYRSLGGASGPLGCATSNEVLISNNPVYTAYRNFRNGAIYHWRGIGEFAVWGAIFATWDARGREHWIGYPTSSEERSVAGTRIRYSTFQHATLWWTPEQGVMQRNPQRPVQLYWYTLQHGACTLQHATLAFRYDGTGTFSARVIPAQRGMTWYIGFKVRDANQQALFNLGAWTNSQMNQSIPVEGGTDDDQPFEMAFSYDPAVFDHIASALPTLNC